MPTVPDLAATTTTTVGASIANVPGPPPPAPVSATPDQIAQANKLEREIVAQSERLDVLAAQYDEAQQKVVTTAATLAQVQAQLATSKATADTANAGVARSSQTLRAVAIDAYVNLGSSSPIGAGGLLATYVEGAARADAETAIGKALDQLQQLHRAEQGLKTAEDAIVAEEQRASDANGAALAAAATAQAAAQGASNQQAQLLGVVSQVNGSLAPLVAAAREAEAQSAFNRFSAAGTFNFAPSAVVVPPSVLAPAAIQVAMAQVGKPYVWGAAGPDSFDCSGLVQWAWGQAGVSLPRVASDQQAWAVPVPISQLTPGDLVFFGSPAHHVGIYVGGGLMVDAPHTGAAVSVVPIWWDDLAGFGRVH
jgi:cell wall-associated NlpC family hydrolase